MWSASGCETLQLRVATVLTQLRAQLGARRRHLRVRGSVRPISFFFFVQGSPEAHCNLSTMYLQGRGVPQNEAEAQRYLDLAVRARRRAVLLFTTS